MVRITTAVSLMPRPALRRIPAAWPHPASRPRPVRRGSRAESRLVVALEPVVGVEACAQRLDGALDVVLFLAWEKSMMMGVRICECGSDSSPHSTAMFAGSGVLRCALLRRHPGDRVAPAAASSQGDPHAYLSQAARPGRGGSHCRTRWHRRRASGSIRRAPSPWSARSPPAPSTDVISRIYATRLSAVLGVPVIVDNKPGAGGTISVNTVARAAPDGYPPGGEQHLFSSRASVYRSA